VRDTRAPPRIEKKKKKKKKADVDGMSLTEQLSVTHQSRGWMGSRLRAFG
jgi:hypothetical protein